MASPQILNALMQGGIDPVARPNWDQKRLAGQQINESQQQMGQRNMLFQQQQEDRQRQMQAQQQEQQNAQAREALAGYFMTPPEQRGVYYQSVAPKFGLPPDGDHAQIVGEAVRSNPGLLGPDLSAKILEKEFAPKQQTGNLPTEEIGVGNGMFQKVQILQDGTTRPLGQPYRKAADASIDLRRDLAGQKAEQEAAKREAAVQATADKFDYTLNLIDDLVRHPGLSAAVGVKGVTGGLLLGQVVPGTDAADFVARLEQIGGRQFLQAFESLKGGGQITQIEGEKATNAIARMQRSQSEEEFKKAALEFRDVLELGLKRLRAAQKVSADPRMPAATVAPQSGGIKFLGFENP